MVMVVMMMMMMMMTTMTIIPAMVMVVVVVMVPVLRKYLVRVSLGLRLGARCVHRVGGHQQGDRIRDWLEQLRIRPGFKTSVTFCARTASTAVVVARAETAPTRPAMFLSISTSPKNSCECAKITLVRN
jgi:hypothetical protein